MQGRSPIAVSLKSGSKVSRRPKLALHCTFLEYSLTLRRMNRPKLSTDQILMTARRSEQFDPATGTVLVLTEQPSGVEFGVDCICYETGPKFRGLSAIPPGLHFIYYGSGMGARQGYFLNANLREVVVHTWDSSNEQIVPSHNLSAESLASLHEALHRGALNAELGPYPMDQYSLWKKNSSYITEDFLRASDCSCGTLLYPGDESSIFNDEKIVDPSLVDPKRYKTITTSSVPVSGEVASTASFIDLKQVEAQLVEQVPRHDPVARAALVTRMMMDKSALLQQLISVHFGGSPLNLLGDLQLSFMLFMLLYSFPALQHWKALVYAICSSESFLRAQPAFAAAFMKVFYHQLSFAPVDFFESELSKENFLRPIIVTLFQSLDSRVEGDGSAAAAQQRWSDSESEGPGRGGEEGDDEEEEDEAVQNVEEHKRRLFNFLRKKFNLFESMSSVLAASPSNASSSDAGMSDKMTSGGLDSFALMQEDQPTYVSEKEILDLQRYGGGGGSTSSAVAPFSTGVYDMSDVGTNPCDARWAATEEQLGYLRRAFGMTEPVNGVSALPVEDMDISDGQPPEARQPAAPAAPMTAMEREIAQFNWRYPLVFGALQRSSATGEYCEDFTMAAMRLLEEAGDLDSANLSSAALEAIKFVEEEVARMR